MKDAAGPAAVYVAAKAKQQALRGRQSGGVDEIESKSMKMKHSVKSRKVEMCASPVSVRSGTGVKIGRDAMSIYTRISRVKNAKNLDEGLRDRRVVVKVSTKSRDAKKRRQSPREDHENLSVLRSRVNSIIHR